MLWAAWDSSRSHVLACYCFCRCDLVGPAANRYNRSFSFCEDSGDFRLASFYRPFAANVPFSFELVGMFRPLCCRNSIQCSFYYTVNTWVAECLLGTQLKRKIRKLGRVNERRACHNRKHFEQQNFSRFPLTKMTLMRLRNRGFLRQLLHPVLRTCSEIRVNYE